jgi:hypothetical protein
MKTKIVSGLLASWLAYESQAEGLLVNIGENESSPSWPIQDLLEETSQQPPSISDQATLSGVMSPMAVVLRGPFARIGA